MFISPAFAQTAGGAGDAGAFVTQLIPFALIIGIMWFMLIRPQQKKMREHRAMIEAIRRNDMVVTAGGLIGKVSKVKDDGELELEIADGVKVRVLRATITSVLTKSDPAPAA